MASELEIAWAAGIIEGEGCVTLHSEHPYLTVDMTDRDVIEKLVIIFPTATFRGPYFHKSKPQHKPRFRFDAFGTKALPILREIYPYMLSRRKARIDEVLKVSEVVLYA